MRRLVFLAVGFLLLVVMVVIRIADPYPVQAIRTFYFDYLQRLAPRAYQDLPVRVVDIDEASLEALGQWPWPRDQLGVLVTRLTEDYGAAAVAFDVIFSEPDRLSPSRILAQPEISRLLATPPTAAQIDALDNDTRFADAIKDHNVILGVANAVAGPQETVAGKAGIVQVGTDPGQGFPAMQATTRIVPALESVAAGIGGINVNPAGEADVIRTVPIAWNSPSGILPSLSLEALRVALGESTIVVTGVSDASGVVTSVGVGGYEIPTTPDGQLWLHYRRYDPALYISAKSVLAPEYDPALRPRLEGNIVLVGASAAGLLDIRTTTLGENVPGVSIHAQMLEQILTGDFLMRGDFESGIEIIAFICLSAIVVAVMSISGPAVSMAAGGVAAFLVLATSLIFFREGQLFDATFPMLGGFAVFLMLAGYQFIVADREKRLIRKSFSHYVAPSVLQEIEQSGHHLELGGQMRTVTVMFCDLRDFTPLSENMAPTDLVSMLNSLFSQLSDCVLSESGTIDKFVGDSLMAFWNAPLDMANHRERACLAALQIRASLQTFNRQRAASALPPLAVAVGLCSGPACVGNIGSRQRFSYSAIGDTVNVAARIEASCRYVAYDVVISEPTHDGVTEMATLSAGRIGLKGKRARSPVYLVVGDRTVAASAPFARLRNLHEDLLRKARDDGKIDPEALEECRRAAQDVEPGLAAFYEKLPQRPGDL